MGYTTDFSGKFQFNRLLSIKEKNYINAFSSTRRMKRDPLKLMEIYKGKYGNPFPKNNTPQGIYGRDGEYFVREDGDSGQSRDASIIDYNTAPGQIPLNTDENYMDTFAKNKKLIKGGTCQPGLWCQWIVDESGEYLEWDGSEKFYNYVEWLQYLIEHFFEEWGVKLNGNVEWIGEDSDQDRGKIVVKDNVVNVYDGKLKVSYRKR